MSNVNLDCDDMTPALFRWSDSVVKGEKMPKSGAKSFCVSENIPGRDGRLSSWSMVFVLRTGSGAERVSEGCAKFLFDEAPDVNSLFNRELKIFDGPRHIADLIFKKK